MTLSVPTGVQQGVTVIEIRPYREGWQCFEGPGVAPYWIGETAKDDAIGYAKARAKFGRGEIRVISGDGPRWRRRPFISFCRCCVETKSSTIRST